MQRPLCLSIVAFCTSGCGGPADVPISPDLSALLAEYERPTAQLDATAAGAALAMLPPLERLGAAFRAGRFTLDEVAPLTEPALPNNSLRVQGSITVTAVCPGALSEPVLDPALNGTFVLTLGVFENLIQRGIGGQANRCVLRGEVLDQDVRVEIDGPVAFDVGRDLGLGQGFSGNLLARFASVNVAGLQLSDVSARFTEGHVEHVFRLRGESLVAALAPTGVTIRDARGLWLCLDSQTTCAPE